MTTVTKFSHVRPNDTPYREEGLRSFFEYRDLGVASATSGKVIVHLVRAKNAPVEGTGWHIHEADFQRKRWCRRVTAFISLPVSATSSSTTRRIWNTSKS